MTTEFASNSPQAVKRWSDAGFRETFGKMTLKPLMGTSPGKAFLVHTDLSRGPGDLVKYDLLKLDRGAGVNGDEQLAGFEDAHDYEQDELRINQKRKGNAYRRMSQQRTLHNLRKDGRSVLSDWGRWFLEGAMFAHMAGTAGDGPENVSAALGGSQGDTDWAGNMIGLADGSAAIDADHTYDTGGGALTLRQINTLKAKAMDINPRMPMCSVGGEDKYILYIDNRQERSLKDEAGDAAWNLIHQRASARANSNNIYTGALGEYNGVILRSSEFVPRVGDVSHAIMIGAGAGVFALGNAWDEIDGSGVDGSYFRISEDDFDYKNKKGIALAMMGGCKRCEFEGKAYGVMTCTSTEPAL